MSELIKPEILKGTRDFLPKEMAKRQYVMDKIRQVFISFGYDAIETPAIEYSKTILGKYGDEGNKLTYRFEDNGGRDICLRYDQTVPTARVVATYSQELAMPFKRYQIGRVWRADKPAKGRFREFYQCDVDIIGSESLTADADIAAVMDRVFTSLGFPEYEIRFNSRRLINSILDSFNISTDQQNAIIRIIDKLDKIGPEKVTAGISKIIAPEIAENLIKVITANGSNDDKIKQLSKFNTTEIQEFITYCQGFGINEKNLVFDPAIARGLDYYTGIIYEVTLPNVAIGSVCAGGRYDDLCSMFTKQKFSGVGVAFGFDRIVVAMEELGLLQNIGLNSQVLVTIFDQQTINTSQEIVTTLQKAGINAEMYPEPAKVGKQFKYANKKEIPFVVIAGPDEIANGNVNIKIMDTGDQKTIPAAQLVDYIHGYQS